MINFGNLAKLEMVIEGKAYHFLCDQNAPVQHAREAITKFLGHCLEIEKAAEAKAKETSK